MKFTYLIIIFLILNVIFYAQCGREYNQIEEKLMTGCWQIETPDNWKFVFKFHPGRWGSIAGSAHSFHLQQKALETEITDISVKDTQIEMNTNPAAQVFYDGKIDLTTMQIKGKLLYQDGTSRQFDLSWIDEKKVPGLYPKRETFDQNYLYQYQSPPKRNDGWETSTLQNEKLDSLLVVKAVQKIIEKKYGQLHSFLLVKNGKLVCEEYFFGHTWQTPHFLASATKSITSLLVGIAVDQKFISSVEQPIFKFFPEQDSLKTPEKEGILLKHLLTMTAGFQGSNPTDLDDDNPVIQELSRPLVTEPGAQFDYDGGSTNLLGGILKSATGLFADEFARQTLFGPLNISNYDWSYGKENGYPDCAGSLRLIPRDFAKIGQMILNGGKWQAQQIVSREWLALSTRKHVEVEKPDHLSYGFQWWQAQKEIGGETVEVFFANGWGSQLMFIFPKLSLIVVTTGGNQENGKHFSPQKMLEDYILPAAI